MPIVLWSFLNKWLCGYCGVGWLSSVHTHQYVSTHQHAIIIITTVVIIIKITLIVALLIIILISRINTRHSGITALNKLQNQRGNWDHYYPADDDITPSTNQVAIVVTIDGSSGSSSTEQIRPQ